MLKFLCWFMTSHKDPNMYVDETVNTENTELQKVIT